MAGFIITEKKKQNSNGFFLQTAAVYAALLSVYAAYHSVFDTGIPFSAASVIILAVVPVLELLVRKERYLGWKILILSVLFGFFVFFFRESFLKGIAPFVNSYIEQRNIFYAVSQPGMNLTPDAREQLIVLTGILFVLGLVLAVALKIRRGSAAALIVMLIPVILAATVGHMPSALTVWALIAARVFYLIIYHRKDGTFPLREIISAAGVLALLWACTFAVHPLIEDYKESHLQEYGEIKEAIIQSQQQQLDVRSLIESQIDGSTNYAAGGVGEGTLENLSVLRPSGTPELEVTVTELPQSRIYLKAYVGTTYTGQRWEELDSFRFSRVISPFGGGTERRELMNEPFSRIENGSSGLKQQQMRIQLLEASPAYGYSPYYAEIPENSSVKLDAYVEGKSSNDREYTFYPQQQAETLGPESLAAASGLWGTYQDFVQDTYLEYPDDLKQLSALCSDISGASSNVEQAADAIDAYFTSVLQYTLTPGKSPSDQDFVEYFLFGNQQGFCVHFASAATLIYRECGYPARYVEGYTVSPDAFTQQEDGTYKAVVTDNMAHAWCETFQQETGWQVREHTLPYQDNRYQTASGTPSSDIQPAQDDQDYPDNTSPDITGDTENENDENAENMDDTGNPEDPGDSRDPAGADDSENAASDTPEGKELSGDTGSENAFISENKHTVTLRRAAGIAGTLLLLLVLAALLCVVQQRIRRQKKLLRFRAKKENRGIAAIYNELYEICIFMGFEKESLTDREAFEQIKTTFPQLTSEEWTWLHDCAVRGAFAGEPINKEERKQFYQLYRKFRKAILQQLNGRKKFWFLYGKGM